VDTVTLRVVLMVVTGAGAALSLLATVYFDAHLWSRRESGYSVFDMMRSTRLRWFDSDVYTAEGNRYRILALRAFALAVVFIVFYALSERLLR
jgi:hypothetical protein